MVEYNTDAMGNITAPMETATTEANPKRTSGGAIGTAKTAPVKANFQTAATDAQTVENTKVMQAKAGLRVLGYNGYEANENGYLRPDVGDVNDVVDDKFRNALQSYRDDHNRANPHNPLGTAATIDQILQTMIKAILTPQGMARMNDMVNVATPGETNQNVKAVQSLLNARGLDVVPNGIADARTTGAMANERARSNIGEYTLAQPLDSQMVYDGYVDVDKIEAQRPVALNDLTETAPAQTASVKEPGVEEPAQATPVSFTPAPEEPAPAAAAPPAPARPEPENTMPDSSLGQFVTNANPVAAKPWFGGDDTAAPAAAQTTEATTPETVKEASPAPVQQAPVQQAPVQQAPAQQTPPQQEGRMIRTQAEGDGVHSYRGPLGRQHPNYGTSDNPYNRGQLSSEYNRNAGGMLGGPNHNGQTPSILPPGMRISGQGGRITGINTGGFRIKF